MPGKQSAWQWYPGLHYNIALAGVTQLVEFQPSKLGVAGSNPVSRLIFAMTTQKSKKDFCVVCLRGRLIGRTADSGSASWGSSPCPAVYPNTLSSRVGVLVSPALRLETFGSAPQFIRTPYPHGLGFSSLLRFAWRPSVLPRSLSEHLILTGWGSRLSCASLGDLRFCPAVYPNTLSSRVGVLVSPALRLETFGSAPQFIRTPYPF